MTTLQELQQEFTTDKNGTIQNPGKFEGESLATPFYYDLMLNGEGSTIKIETSDHLAFGIEDKYTYVHVFEDSMGFINLFICETKEEAESFETDNPEDHEF